MTRRHAPATDRNRDPILEVLRSVLPKTGTVIELAAGTGQHTAYFSQAFPNLRWCPTDRDVAALASIGAWTRELPNVDAPRVMDATSPAWTDGADEEVAAVMCINMIHISPWDATEGLMQGAGRRLQPGGVLVTYGPYRVDGEHTAPSNERFEGWLKSLDPRFGVRDMADVCAEASKHGLELERCVAMPANNFTLVFGKTMPGD